MKADSPLLTVAVELPQHAGRLSLLQYVSEQPLAAGTLIRVPLGRRDVAGIVWDAVAEPAAGATLKPVRQALAALPPLAASWRRLVEFAAGYYQRGLGELALAVLPPELRRLDDAALAKRIARLAAPAAAAPVDQAPPLTIEQQACVAAALAAPAAPSLLHGVTGSGKTEVYLHAAEQVLRQGRQVLVLVPEINLTPQLEARLAARFGPERLAALHSALTPAQRLKAWLRAHLGSANVVVGTRLAVFASMPRLGLIVVDEEHDPSYKQQEGARYSARDLAVYRGRLEQVPVLLGSATPSLESWQRADEGRYRRLTLAQRIGGGALPRLRVVDMGLLPRARGAPAPGLAPALVQALQARCERGEQSLVLLNRRGYAPVLHCTDCGWKSACPHCSAWRVFHRADRSLRCHHCGSAQPVPRACPDCGNLDIAGIGRGTERLEEQLQAALPGARIARIDADSTRAKGALEAGLAAVHAGEVDVLVGTQMIAKGHDFRRITLVAAVNPDSALFASDFRAPERLFALLMQAAGRAGREAAQSAGAEMWLQTWHPRHPLYAALARHDMAAFASAPSAARPDCRRTPPSRCCAPRRVMPRRPATSCARPPRRPRSCPVPRT
jgi:primosomal protein N' (replication factor Y)